MQIKPQDRIWEVFYFKNFIFLQIGIRKVVSIRDGVSYLDPFGFYNGCCDEECNVVLLGSLKDGCSLIDHPLSTVTYQT